MGSVNCQEGQHHHPYHVFTRVGAAVPDNGVTHHGERIPIERPFVPRYHPYLDFFRSRHPETREYGVYMALKCVHEWAMEGALQCHLWPATRQEALSHYIGNQTCVLVLTSPRASALAPRRSKKHSTAPSGRATRRIVPSYPTPLMN